MGAVDDESSPWLWTRPQRRVLVALTIASCFGFSIRYAFNRAYISDPQPVRGPRYDEVVDKIDPNTADVATLSALPMIGDRRAQDIVDYRESRRAEGFIFERVEDFLQIRGFGRASIETMRPYLMFPTSASQPSTQR